MKKTKLLAATAMLLLTSCSPKVVTHIVRTYPNPVPADSVYVIEPGDTVPNTAETLGSVSVVDRGTSRNCRYDQVLRLAQEATGKNGGNGLAITEHVKPSFWGSSCHQINALMLRLTDTKVNATEGNPVQDMIDLGRVAVKEPSVKPSQALASSSSWETAVASTAAISTPSGCRVGDASLRRR